MKLPSKKMVYLTLLISLLVVDLSGLLHFFRTPNFVLFLLIAAVGTLVSAVLFWFEWIQKPGLTYFEVCFLSMFSLSLIAHVARHEVFSTILTAAASVLVLIFPFRRLVRSDYQTKGKEMWAAGELREKRHADADGFLVLFLLLSFVGLPIFLFHRQISMMWSFPCAVPVLWYSFCYVVETIDAWRMNPDGNLSIINRHN
jgi:hypothetical protein